MYIIAFLLLFFHKTREMQCFLTSDWLLPFDFGSFFDTGRFFPGQGKTNHTHTNLSTCSWLWRTTTPGLTVFRVWQSCKAQFKMSSTIRAFIIQSFISTVGKYKFKYIQLTVWPTRQHTFKNLKCNRSSSKKVCRCHPFRNFKGFSKGALNVFL